MTKISAEKTNISFVGHNNIAAILHHQNQNEHFPTIYNENRNILSIFKSIHTKKTMYKRIAHTFGEKSFVK